MNNHKFFNLKTTLAALLIAGTICALGFLFVEDFGLTLDSGFYFYRGEAYLNFLLTGEKNYAKDKIKCRFQDEFRNPFNYDLLSKEPTPKKKMLYNRAGESSYGGFTGLLSALGCEIFFKKLNLLTDIGAHHFAYIILAAISVFFYFLFVCRAFGLPVAIFSTIFLALFPRFIGHVPNNPKDSVVACLGIMAISVFWLAMQKRNWRYLIPFAALMSFAVTTKYSGYIIFAILFLWSIGYFIRNKKYSLNINKKFWGYLGFSLGLFFLLVYILTPSKWVDPWGVFSSLTGLFKYSYQSPVTWTSEFSSPAAFDVKKKIFYAFFPMGLVLITTPVFTLLAGITGFFLSLKEIKKSFFSNQIDNNLLIVLWFLAPIIIASLPGPAYYVRTLRHFMLFMPALCILAGLGINWFIKFAGDKLKNILPAKPAILTVWLIIFLGFSSIVVSIVDIHPYETTFFNRLIGGVAGARNVKFPGGRTGIPFATDFWCNSFRSGMEWLNKNALPNSKLTVTYGEQTVVYAKELRNDIVLVKEADFSFDMPREGPFYVMIIPTYWEEQYDGLLQYCYKNLAPVYTIKSQGAPILLIYKL